MKFPKVDKLEMQKSFFSFYYRVRDILGQNSVLLDLMVYSLTLTLGITLLFMSWEYFHLDGSGTSTLEASGRSSSGINILGYICVISAILGIWTFFSWTTNRVFIIAVKFMVCFCLLSVVSLKAIVFNDFFVLADLVIIWLFSFISLLKT